MENLVIADFNIKNIDKILEIEKESFSNHWSKQMFLAETENKFSRFKICLADSSIIGFIIYRIVLEEAEILNIVIGNKFRGKSFGRQLLKYAVNNIKENKVKNIFLEVNERNIVAQNLYKDGGFVQYSTRQNYYGNDHAVLMKLSLC
ncbi:MAG: ribosomal protein S18-alanine N-acetyltransferase [Endomicrobiaceae bacterium]|nr:ribosomal protein S18-alanine N-acetyltransferase [Endomicrobiaceae bacterium]